MPKFCDHRQRRRQRFAALIVALALATPALTACTPANSQPDRPVVLATFSVLADIVSAVGGEHIEVQSITKVGAEIHGYEPTPGDIRQGVHADLIVENGWGLESWFDQFVSSIDAPVVTLTDGLDPINISGDAYEGKPNPHAWMSPKNVEQFVVTIERELAALDPEHAADFAKNAAAYTRELQEVQRELTTALDTIAPSQRTLITCEGAFSYLARDAGLDEAYIWPVNAEQQVTPQRLADVIDTVERTQAPAVFCESTVSDRPMQQVVSATNTTFGGTLYVDSLSLETGPVPTYLALIRHDVTTIVSALTQESQ